MMSYEIIAIPPLHKLVFIEFLGSYSQLHISIIENGQKVAIIEK